LERYFISLGTKFFLNSGTKLDFYLSLVAWGQLAVPGINRDDLRMDFRSDSPLATSIQVLYFAKRMP